jgi:hypothetical protein
MQEVTKIIRMGLSAISCRLWTGRGAVNLFVCNTGGGPERRDYYSEYHTVVSVPWTKEL